MQRSTKIMELGNLSKLWEAFRWRRAVRGKDATKAAIMLASKDRNSGFVRSSRFLKASRKVGSWGNGVRGCIYVKKSSTSNCKTPKGAMHCSASNTICPFGVPNDTRAWAAFCSGGVGSWWMWSLSSTRRRFSASRAASAARLGGPRLFLMRSYVQGTFSSRQGRQGGGPPSHWMNKDVSVSST